MNWNHEFHKAFDKTEEPARLVWLVLLCLPGILLVAISGISTTFWAFIFFVLGFVYLFGILISRVVYLENKTQNGG